MKDTLVKAGDCLIENPLWGPEGCHTTPLFSEGKFTGDISLFHQMNTGIITKDTEEISYWCNKIKSNLAIDEDEKNQGETWLFNKPEQIPVGEWHTMESYHDEWSEIFFGASIESRKDFHRIDLMKDLSTRGRFMKNIVWIMLTPYEPMPMPNLKGIDYIVMNNQKEKPIEGNAIKWTDSIYQQCHELEIPFYFRRHE